MDMCLPKWDVCQGTVPPNCFYSHTFFKKKKFSLMSGLRFTLPDVRIYPGLKETRNSWIIYFQFQIFFRKKVSEWFVFSIERNNLVYHREIEWKNWEAHCKFPSIMVFSKGELDSFNSTLITSVNPLGQWGRSGVFIVNSEHIYNFFLLFLLLTLKKWMLITNAPLFQSFLENI